MVIDHVHTYVFYDKRNGEKYYKCDDPHCHHFSSVKMILNKASICAGCKQRELILTRKALRNRRPLCLECANTNEAKEFRKSKELMDNIFARKEA